MTLYPHEWLWQKMKAHNQIACIWSIATISVLLIGYITFWVAINYPTTNAWPVNTLNQPSAFSYAPIIVTWFIMILGLLVYSYYYSEDKNDP